MVMAMRDNQLPPGPAPEAEPAGASVSPPAGDPPRVLPPAARRALAEAEERRRQAASEASPAPPEVGGRDGPDPARYGDWEKAGIVSDF